MSRREMIIDTETLRGTAVDTPALRALLVDSAFASAWRQREIIKEDQDRCVVLLRDEVGTPYLLKCFHPSRAKRFLQLLGGRDTVAQTHAALQWLFARDVSVPQSLAVLQWKKSGGKAKLWCHLQEYLADSATLHQALTRDNADDPVAQADLIAKTMTQLAHLHQLKRYHGDMKLNNAMVRGGQVYLVDVKGRGSLRLRRHQYKDVARFLVGLMEAKINEQQITASVAAYQGAMGHLGSNFVDGVGAAAAKITRRHAHRYHLPMQDKLHSLITPEPHD